VALVVALVVGYGIKAASSGDPGSSSASSASSASPASASASAESAVALSSLPTQAATTVRLIQARGPFPYPRNDGVVFHNNEHVLPRESDGYYHEYTVPTPGSRDRGARRIITGRGGQYYYTADHYETFQRVDVTR
jgi:ribonuclease T1